MSSIVHELSAKSIYLEMYFDEQKLSSGTGFIVKYNEKFFLLTNLHNLTGKNFLTGKCLSSQAATPNKIKAFLHEKDNPISTDPRELLILDQNGRPNWLEHPSLRVDIGAICLTNYTPSHNLHYELKTATPQESYTPGCRLNIIGFPFGKSTAQYLAIWTTGYLASDIDINIDNKPIFYIDARTRQGQSGSPVVFHRYSEAVAMANGDTSLPHSCSNLLGIYSGRISNDSDIGIAWKATAIHQIITYHRERNKPCPCLSGESYKHCHGKISW